MTMAARLNAGADMVVPTCSERQALIRMIGTAHNYEHSFLLQRIDGPRWAVADADGTVTIDDLSVEEVVPLVAGRAFPVEGRPFLVRPVVDEGWIAPLKVRARQLAELQNAALAPVAPPVMDAEWFFADPAHVRFATVCDMGALAGQMHLEGSSGIVQVEPGAAWTFVERVLAADVMGWKAEKQHGAGRDPRLSSLPLTTGGETMLFRVALSRGESVSGPPEGFAGSSAFMEFASSIARSGLEPTAYAEHLIATSGVGRMSAIANELRNHVWSINYLVTVDRFNAGRLATAEHVSRRALQLLRAVKRNPRAPSFEGLDAYMEHMDSATGAVRAPEFEKHVMEQQKAEAFVLKQQRLMRDEEEADRKRSNAGGGGEGRGGDGRGRGRGRGKDKAGRGGPPPAADA